MKAGKSLSYTMCWVNVGAMPILCLERWLCVEPALYQWVFLARSVTSSSHLFCTSHTPNAFLVLGHGLRRWPNTEPALCECISLLSGNMRGNRCLWLYLICLSCPINSHREAAGVVDHLMVNHYHGLAMCWNMLSQIMETRRFSQFEIFDFDFELVLQQHLLFGVSGWRGERAGGLSQPADSWTLPQFLILWQLPRENSNQG